jgi:hypothetical protein
MAVPIKPQEFPCYFKDGRTLLAFVEKDKMFKIEPIGSNKNSGVTIDHYTTRSMVRKHWPDYAWTKQLTKREFTDLLHKLYGAYIDKITSW